MAWTWQEITAADDALNVDILNRLLRAVNRRALATGQWPLLGPGLPPSPGIAGGLYADPPTVTPDVYSLGNGPAPLLAVDYRPAGSWKHNNVLEMQKWLYDVAPWYVDDVTYPDGPVGWDTSTVGLSLPNRYLMLYETIANRLGYYFPPAWSTGYNPPGSNPWFLRRKVPRRIQTLTQQNSGCEWTGFGLPAKCPFVTGNLAQWYDLTYGGAGIETPDSGGVGNGATTANYGGRYRGVYRFDGTKWVVAPEGASADILTSDAPAGGNMWTPAGFFREGDYYGWWLLEDIRLVCECLTTTFNERSTRAADGTQDAYDRYEGGSLGYHTTLAAAWAAAEADLPTNHDVLGGGYPSGGSGSAAYWYEIPPGSASAGAAQAAAEIATWTWTTKTYDMIPREVSYFVDLLDIEVGTNLKWWDGNTGFPKEKWALVGKRSYVASSHDYPVRDGPDWTPHLPSWPGVAPGINSYFDMSVWTTAKWRFDD